MVDSLLEKRLTGLRSAVDSSLVDLLEWDIRHKNDDEVYSVQPYRWARDRGVEKRRALELFLLATKEGVLEQHWSMLCPNCRVPKATARSMKEVEGRVHCDLCGFSYELDFDRSIEMRFTIHPSIRRVHGQVFCLNGPMNSPHVVAQYRLPPGETVVRVPEVDQGVRFRDFET